MQIVPRYVHLKVYQTIFFFRIYRLTLLRPRNRASNNARLFLRICAFFLRVLRLSKFCCRLFLSLRPSKRGDFSNSSRFLASGSFSAVLMRATELSTRLDVRMVKTMAMVASMKAIVPIPCCFTKSRKVVMVSLVVFLWIEKKYLDVHWVCNNKKIICV